MIVLFSAITLFWNTCIYKISNQCYKIMAKGIIFTEFVSPKDHVKHRTRSDVPTSNQKQDRKSQRSSVDHTAVVSSQCCHRDAHAAILFSVHKTLHLSASEHTGSNTVGVFFRVAWVSFNVYWASGVIACTKCVTHWGSRQM